MLHGVGAIGRPVDREGPVQLLPVGIDGLEVELIDPRIQIHLEGEVAVRIGDDGRPLELPVGDTAPRVDEGTGGRVTEDGRRLAVGDAPRVGRMMACLLYTSDAADEL